MEIRNIKKNNNSAVTRLFVHLDETDRSGVDGIQMNVDDSVLIVENAEPVSANQHEERRGALDVEDVADVRI